MFSFEHVTKLNNLLILITSLEKIPIKNNEIATILSWKKVHAKTRKHTLKGIRTN